MNKIGYASLNVDLPKANFKTVRLKNFTEERLKALIAHNLDSLEQMVDYNIKFGIKMVRISSSLIPFGSHRINTLDWQKEFSDKLTGIRAKLLKRDIRFSVHPGQYTVLNSLDEAVVSRAILELEYHVKILESLGGNQSNKMILHIGGVYGDKESATARFIDVANNRLSEGVRRHLVIENDERSYSAKEVFMIAQKTSLPMVFDTLHHRINPSFTGLNDQEIIKQVNRTWKHEDGRQKIHYSQQDPGKRPGAHSSTIDLKIFKEFYQTLDVDIMLEVKDKNRSALKVNLLLEPDQKELEKEWARYKYLLMSKSYSIYNKIRQLFSGNQTVDVIEFYTLVDQALDLPVSKSQEIVAVEHVWGYFKREVEDHVKSNFMTLLEDYKKDKVSLKKLKKYLYTLSINHGQTYLLESYYFNE